MNKKEFTIRDINVDEPPRLEAAYGRKQPPTFNSTIRIIYAACLGERDALIKLKEYNDKLEGEAAALRGNLLQLVIDNMSQLVLSPLQELFWR